MDFVFFEFNVNININKNGVIVNTQNAELPLNDLFVL